MRSMRTRILLKKADTCHRSLRNSHSQILQYSARLLTCPTASSTARASETMCAALGVRSFSEVNISELPWFLMILEEPEPVLARAYIQSHVFLSATLSDSGRASLQKWLCMADRMGLC